MNSKVISLDEAAHWIKDGDTIATSGFGVGGHPEEILVAIEKRFLQSGQPTNLTVIHAAGQGDWKGAGIDHLAHAGLLKRLIGGHCGTCLKLVDLINQNKIEAYNFPQGVICHLYRAIAAKKPGDITKVGLKTYIDPRLEGGRLNSCTTENLVQLIQINGEEWLLYPSLPIQMALIRGTTADEHGNISMEEEASFSEGLAIAQAAKASGGKVIVQVKYLARAGSLDAQLVKIPGILVDAIVVSKQPEQYHRQTGGTFFSAVFAGHVKIPLSAWPALPLDEKKVIARRAARELTPHAIVNLGIGLPEFVAAIAAEEKAGDQLILSIEAGQTGGIPASGMNFGAVTNPWAMIDQGAQFDFYDGGNLDMTFLGLAQASQGGDVNVSKFGSKIAGCGGFINITQNTRKVIFCGRFTAGKFKAEIGNGKITILQEGGSKKFIKQVEQITFSGAQAIATGQQVVFITERAVFALRKEGLVLTEIAPGADMQKDILAQMEFEPVIAKDLKLMESAIFSEGPIGLNLEQYTSGDSK